MRRAMLVMGLLATTALAGSGLAQPGGDPPHAWVFGSWTGGIYPPTDTEGPRCTGQPTVIFTRDVVMRASAFEIPYRQRLIETVAAEPNALEFRFVPAPPQNTPFGARLPNDVGFGCPVGPNGLRVERRGPDEIAFPNCSDFPSPLRRCVGR